MTEVEFGRFGRATTDAAGPLGEGTVGCVVDESFETTADRVAFGPDDKVIGALDELRTVDAVGASRTADGLRGVVKNPLGDIAAVAVVVVGGCRTVVHGRAAADCLGVGFGSAGADLVTHHVARREFFRMLAVGKVRLFVAKEDVGAQTGWVVPEGGIGSQARAVEVDTAVEFEQDVFG